MSARNNLTLLFLMEFFAGLARGAFLVCMGWTVLVVSNDVAKVGQIFIAVMLTNIFIAPLAGVIVDRYIRKYVIIVAHLFIAIPLFGLALLLAKTAENGFSLSLNWFFVAVVISSAARLAYQLSHDGLIHANVGKTKLVYTVARFRTVHLLATSIGTVCTGLIINRFSPATGFVFAASLSLALIVPVLFIARINVSREKSSGFSGLLMDIVGGLEVFQRNQQVRIIAVLAMLALPIGQLSNSILSSLIYDDLGRDSAAFGFVDAAWPVGGMLGALLLSTGFRLLSMNNAEFIFAIFAGLATILLSLAASLNALALAHAAMGFSVWLCSIIIDGRVLQVCRPENVGRTKAYTHMMVSLSALLMCFSPTLVKLSSTGGYFLFWGITVTIGAFAVFFWRLASTRNE